jgi:hypothetical protein
MSHMSEDLLRQLPGDGVASAPGAATGGTLRTGVEETREPEATFTYAESDDDEPREEGEEDDSNECDDCAQRELVELASALDFLEHLVGASQVVAPTKKQRATFTGTYAVIRHI